MQSIKGRLYCILYIIWTIKKGIYIMNYHHILFATDFAKDSSLVASKAEAMAKEFDAQLSIVHIVEPLPAYAYGYLGQIDVENQVVEEAKQELVKLAEKLNVPENHQFIRIGIAKHEILTLAKEINADLIIVGSHGHAGLSQLLGSTATSIIHGAHCDVLTVRIPDPK